ncbi:hypothetical protein O1611_g1214 [Lasiodiplodia mahajangana]|uniref:Uncharacterized protein n=1 Tax=Lasiodiplodia mahajangana TaxID=1108764 RepID=A0ACC2JYA9_9PEZI|nr:hypothetical protein O1611_g1214 [Lasiodiplodia mahajangana]
MELSNREKEGFPLIPTIESDNEDSSLTQLQHISSGQDDQGINSSTNTKRKNVQPGSSAKPRPNKMRKLGKKELNNRKDELKFESIFDLSARVGQSSSENDKYTPEQHKRHETQLHEALTIFGKDIEKAGYETNYPNELFRVKGMRTALRDYQVVGAAFMVRQERLRNDSRGSIIADDMGIGKTIQSIACMMTNPPSAKAKNEGRGATLIVAPNQGLLNQWSNELETHGILDSDDICLYAGGGKMKAPGIRGHRFVLATYSQVQKDFKLHNTKAKKGAGALFNVEFYRIILDEGDNIKNSHGSTSKACIELEATVRHVLSGTPIRNSIQGHIIQIAGRLATYANEGEEDFEKKWGKPKSNSDPDRIMQILAYRMLRREAGRFFLGRAVCELPESNIENRILDLSDEEAIISRHMEEALLCREAEAKDGIQNPELGPDPPRSNYHVRCTRLRQAADHPFLLEACLRECLTSSELEALIAEIVENRHSKSICEPTRSSSSPFEPSIYEMALDIKSHLDDTLSSHGNDCCLECFSLEQLHELPLQWIEKLDLSAPAAARLLLMCLNQRGGFDPKSLLGKSPVKPTSEVFKTTDGRSISVIPPDEMSMRHLGADYNGIQLRISSKCCGWLNKCDKLGQVTPSTKTVAAINIVNEWQDRAPDDKIVIFTEWIATAMVLGRLLNKSNVNFVYYNGEMSTKSKEKSLEAFKNDPNIKVMVASMGTGNVGLNITAANRMIIMNPWWNYAAETQAFGRVKRHGQRKPTYLVRLFGKDTIDERIFTLQEKKETDIKEAMSQGRKSKPLTHQEKRWLMGDRAALENPFIDSDDETIREEDSSEED